MRFVAAFMVVLTHTRNDLFMSYGSLDPSQQGVIPFAYFFICRLGHEAVLAFFVISGFLVGGRGLERIFDKNFDNKQYVIDRTVRIGIPLAASLLFCIITYEAIGKEYSLATAIGNLFSLQGVVCGNFISPLWSLSYEVWFYVILLGFSFAFSRKYWSLPILLICTLVFARLNAMYLLIWLMGAFAYLCRPKSGNKLIMLSSLIAIIVSFALSIMSSDSRSIALAWKPDNKMMEAIVAASMCVFIQQIILFEPRNKTSIAINRWFSYLAGFSYTLYLTHRITLLWFFNYVFDYGKADFSVMSIAKHIALIVACVFVSWVIYLFTERHTAMVKRFIKSKC